MVLPSAVTHRIGYLSNSINNGATKKSYDGVGFDTFLSIEISLFDSLLSNSKARSLLG